MKHFLFLSPRSCVWDFSPFMFSFCSCAWLKKPNNQVFPFVMNLGDN